MSKRPQNFSIPTPKAQNYPSTAKTQNVTKPSNTESPVANVPKDTAPKNIPVKVAKTPVVSPEPSEKSVSVAIIGDSSIDQLPINQTGSVECKYGSYNLKNPPIPDSKVQFFPGAAKPVRVQSTFE